MVSNDDGLIGTELKLTHFTFSSDQKEQFLRGVDLKEDGLGTIPNTTIELKLINRRREIFLHQQHDRMAEMEQGGMGSIIDGELLDFGEERAVEVVDLAGKDHLTEVREPEADSSGDGLARITTEEESVIARTREHHQTKRRGGEVLHFVDGERVQRDAVVPAAADRAMEIGDEIFDVESREL